jgi:exopolyphosphatase/guanosine-5'-triphosphate,3'-diphosphate pyrophosphatase
MYKSPYFAAIDLGSNSFHMIVGRVTDSGIEIVDREKEMVQIARGLDDDGELSQDAQQRALDCLHRFSERIRDIPSENVRAVGTKTLRAARNSRLFLHQAEARLGQPIQIVSGYEEARLVYKGLAHSVSNDSDQRLVIDIGGGSTEFVIGKGFQTKLLESLNIGCVSFTKMFFTEEQTLANSMRKTYLEACDELESIRRLYIKRGWSLVYGTSGTIKAIAELISEDSIIRADALAELYKSTTLLERIKASALPKLRREVIAAGVAILKAIFDELEIDEMHVSSASLKDGLLYETLGRFGDSDTREHTVEKLKERYQVDEEQALRVEKLAIQLWQDIKESEENISGVSRTKALKWAADLHEIGLSISHSSYHNHGFYLLNNSDLAGFGRYEQYILGMLVRFHRKKLRKDSYAELQDDVADAFTPILLCLRLAVAFCRRREDIDAALTLSHRDGMYKLTVDSAWMDAHPLTKASIKKEISNWKNVGVELILDDGEPKA